MNDIEYMAWCQKQARKMIEKQQKDKMAEFEKDTEYQKQKQMLFENASVEHEESLSDDVKSEVSYYDNIVKNGAK